MTSPIPPRESSGSVAELAAWLSESALPLGVEALGGVAVLTPLTAELPVIDAPLRRRIVEAARAAGFVNVALEILVRESTTRDAALPGSESF